MADHAEKIAADLLDPITGGPVAESPLEHPILGYLVERMTNLTPSHLEALMGTVAEAWIEQGIEQGKAEGRAEGIAQGRSKGQSGIVLRLLHLRFGRVPDPVRARIRHASAAELETWAEAVLEATTLDEVFAARPRS